MRTLGDLAGAERKLAPLLNTRNEATLADALAERARLRQRQNRPQEALADLRRADALYARLKLDFDRIDSSSALAMALLATGDVKGASTAADTAIAIETRIRVSSANPELRARFLSASYAPYEARIEAELAGPAQRDPSAVWNAFLVAERLRARSLADRLTHLSRRENMPRDERSERMRETMTALQRDLERQTRRGVSAEKEILETRRLIDETRSQLEARVLGQRGVRAGNALSIPETREAMQAALPEGTAVLAYFVGDHRSHAWLLTRQGLRHRILPGRRTLDGLVHAFITQRRAGAPGPRDPALAPILGDLLDDFTGDRLLILPDGPLNSLPFAAMPLPRGGAREQLIDRFVISAAPSLALALRPSQFNLTRKCASRSFRIRCTRRHPVCRCGHGHRHVPRRGRGTRPSRTPAYSAIEARAVVRASKAPTDRTFRLQRHRATCHRTACRDTRFLHFATHAMARRDAPEQSACSSANTPRTVRPCPVTA